MRALRASARAEGRRVFVYFVSASPAADRPCIREKLALDGVEIDGIVFKDQLQHLVRGRFRFLREQIGFKLAELLKARSRRRPTRSSISSATIGSRTRSATRSTPTWWRVDSTIKPSATSWCASGSTRRDWSRSERSRAACRRSMPSGASSSISSAAPRRVASAVSGARGPTFNYFQTALVLHEEGMVPLAAVVAVGHSLIDRATYTRGQLRNSLDDLVRRGHLRHDDPALRRDLEESACCPRRPRRARGRSGCGGDCDDEGVRRRSRSRRSVPSSWTIRASSTRGSRAAVDRERPRRDDGRRRALDRRVARGGPSASRRRSSTSVSPPA
jgi:hypothetical protein